MRVPLKASAEVLVHLAAQRQQRGRLQVLVHALLDLDEYPQSDGVFPVGVAAQHQIGQSEEAGLHHQAFVMVKLQHLQAAK